MREIHQRDGSECAVWSHLRSGSHLVVRISDVNEVGEVEFLSESVLAPDQLYRNVTLPQRGPGMGNRKRTATLAPAVAPKRLFEFDDESIVLPKGRGVCFDDPNFEVTLKSREKTATSHRSGRSRHAAPVFQSSPR